jgi:prepilin-type processing-associated H-X9-DG protein
MALRTRNGKTLLDVIVVGVMLGIVAAPLLSAIQLAREAQRREQCVEYLQRLATAFQAHHDSQRGLPPARTTLPANHGWCVNLLPYVDRADLHARYRFDKHFYEAENQAVVQTELDFLICPSAPSQSRVFEMGMGAESFGTKGVASDYFVNHLLNPMGAGPTGQLRPALHAQNKLQPLTAITDGLSQTTLIHEQAGRPDFYLLGKKQDSQEGPLLANWWSAWASYHHFRYQGYTADGKQEGWECSLNCNNGQGIFSFHPPGSNAAFCDGSVRFLRQSIPVELVFALASRDGEEILSSHDWQGEQE